GRPLTALDPHSPVDGSLRVVNRADLDIGVIGRVDFVDLPHAGDVFEPVADEGAGHDPVRRRPGQLEQELITDVVDAEDLCLESELSRVTGDDRGRAGDVLDHN